MALNATALAALYCSPFAKTPTLTVAVVAVVFPLQVLFWRLSYGRKAKDFFFCFSTIVLALLLKHHWVYADLIFYALAILSAAVLRYRIFIATGAAALGLEMWREFFYFAESAQDIAFRYLLFWLAGSLTFLLLREETRKKEVLRKELDDLRYGIQEVSTTELSDDHQVARAVDAVLALDDSLKNIVQLIFSLFKPEKAVFWQYLPEESRLRIRTSAGDVSQLPAACVVDLGQGPIGWAALNRKPFWQQDRPEGIAYSGSSKRAHIHSMLAVPVVNGERLEGVLSIDSKTMNYFPNDTDRALSSFGTQVAETIRMARLAREREERAVEFQAFYRASRELSSIIEFDEIIRKLHLLCAEIVPFDFSIVAVLNPQTNTYSAYQWTGKEESAQSYSNLPNDGRSWLSWFLCNREEPLIVSQDQLELQQMRLIGSTENFPPASTFLVAPLRHQQTCVGALVLGSNHAYPFSSHQTRIISILSNQAAVSLENSSIIDRMEELAVTDGLTGLFNHRYFQEALQKELERAQRQKQPLSLLIMDIDHFKGFNDSFGHPAGDFVLKSLGGLLRNNARKIDVLARYGGEEFAALLPGINVKNARKTAERWRKAVQRSSFKWEDKAFAITLSMGFSTFPDDGESKVDLIEKADQALYDAKENGRNQVRHFSEKLTV